MFWGVPGVFRGDPGMFRGVPGCSGFYRHSTLIEKGEVSVVFGSPEVWIKIERRRAMLGNSVYSNKLYALAIDEAHVIR